MRDAAAAGDHLQEGLSSDHNSGMDMPVENISAEQPRWGLARRVLFRFAFVYLVLYIVPFPLDSVPGVNVATSWCQEQWHKFVPWIGKQIFGLDITIFPGDSGDTTYNYVEVFCYAAIATIATFVWSILDWQRSQYSRLHDWLRVYVRFYLGLAIIGYGLVKVIKIQFSDLDLDKLTEPYGEASPMGLLWTFMGFSTAYNVFAGTGELLGGVLLFWRRTTMAGALILVGVVGHIVALNFCFDVPVKLFSSHLLLMAMFLFLPDLNRLVRFAVLNKPVAPAELGRPFKRRWANITATVAKYVLVGASLVLSVLNSVEMSGQIRASKPTASLYGLYDVMEFSSDGKTIPATFDESSRWRRVIINRFGGFTVVLVNEQRLKCFSKDDTDKKTLSLTMRGRQGEMPLTYERSNSDEVLLSGMFQDKAITARLKKVETPTFLLMTRGFHWINEYPYHY